MSIRIIVADDHKIVREGLCSLLRAQADMEVIAEAKDGRQAVKQVRELAPDIVIMDVTMPDMNGIEATRQVITARPRVKVLALSMHEDKRIIAQILKAGAMGYLLKDCAFEELLRAIRTVYVNQVYLSPAIAGLVVRDYVDTRTEAGPELSTREREVLQLLAEGKTVKEIASQFSLSVKTVETHRLRIMDKLDMRSVAELTKYAIREGWTSLSP